MTTNTMNTQSLITALTDSDRSVRQAAAMALGSAHTPAAADALVARLGTETDCFVREALTWATVQAGPDAVDGVLRQLTSPSPTVRMQAAHVLSKIGDPAHAPQLIPVVADTDPEVAAKAFRAAANTGDPAVVPALAGRLGDGDLGQQDALNAAFATLGEVGIPALIGALSDEVPAVRQHAADALGHVGSPAGDPAVVALIGLLADPDADVRFAAVSALGELDRELTGEALAEAAASTDPVVGAVAKRLLNR